MAKHSTDSLEERVTRLEQAVFRGPAIVGKASEAELWAKKDWWKRAHGMFENDETFEEVLELINKEREEEAAIENAP